MSSIGYTIIVGKFKNALIDMDRDTRVGVLNEMKNKLLGDSSHLWVQELFMNAQHASDNEFATHYVWFSATNHKDSRKLTEMMYEVVKYASCVELPLPLTNTNSDAVRAEEIAATNDAMAAKRAEAIAKAEEENKAAAAAATKIKEAERAKAEAERIEHIKSREISKKQALIKWIDNGAYCGHSFDGRQQNRFRIDWYWSSDSELELDFWKHMAEVAFAKCHSCGKTPRINRWETMTYVGKTYFGMKEGMFPNHVTGGGDYQGYGSSVVKSLSCCEHLYDFEQKRRYIKVSALKHNDLPKYKYQVCIKLGRDSYGKDEMGYSDNVYLHPDCNPEYVLYNTEDPDGSLALVAHQHKEKLERIKNLKSSIVSMQKELEELQKELS